MSRQSNTDEVAIQYLLGALSDQAKARFEEAYFSDDERFEELEIAEDELIDRYVRGELSQTDKDRFESTLAKSARLMERAQFARVWKNKFTPDQLGRSNAVLVEAKTATSWWERLLGFSTATRTPRLAGAFAVLFIVLGGIALFVGWIQLREESRRLAEQRAALDQQQRELDQQAAELKAQADQLAKKVPPEPSPSLTPAPITEPNLVPPRPVFGFTLLPGTLRGGSGARKDVRIPPDALNIQISLEVGDSDYASYRATVNRDGGRVFSSPFLILKRVASGNVFILSVSAKLLSPADYTIRLDGRTSAGAIEPVDDYSFRVIK